MHLVNVTLHAINTLLLFVLLRTTTASVWRSALVAAIFAVHPMHVESVAWITERKDVLSGLFGLLALLAYVRYARRPSLVRSLWVIGALALGLMCKPMLVTWPLLFLLLDYWPLGRISQRSTEGLDDGQQSALRRFIPLIIEKLPYLPLIAASAFVTFLLQRSYGAVAPLDSVPILARIARATVLYVAYIGKSLWPANLAVYPVEPAASYNRPALGAALVLALLTAGVLWGARRGRPWLATGWFWYLITLLPTIGLLQAGSEVMADRFLYLPQIGLSIAVVWFLADLAGQSVKRRFAFSVAGLLALLAYAGCAARQTAFWRDDLTFWTRTLDCTRNNFIAHLHLGLAWANRGQLDKAMKQYEEALRIYPEFSEARFNLASALSSQGKVDAAQRQYEIVLRIRPGYPKARNNLGMLLLNHGELAAATEQFQKAVDSDPNYALAQNNLGIALMASAQYDAAAERFRRAIALDANLTLPHGNLGYVLARTGHSAEAVAELRSFLAVEPGHPKVLAWLAFVLATARDDAVRDGPQALELARKAAALTHETDPVVLDALAAALAETGQYAAAVKMAQAASDSAQAAGQSNVAAEIQQRSELYRHSQPFRQ